MAANAGILLLPECDCPEGVEGMRKAQWEYDLVMPPLCEQIKTMGWLSVTQMTDAKEVAS